MLDEKLYHHISFPFRNSPVGKSMTSSAIICEIMMP